MKNKRIPTILAFIMLIVALALGVFIQSKKQDSDLLKMQFLLPKNIEVVNLKDKEATIIWQTDQAIFSEIIYGTSGNLSQSQKDQRDNPKSLQLLHFVTLKNLTPDTTYFYKIKSDEGFLYPDKPLEFKTPKTLENSSSSDSYIQGTILDENLTPAQEVLITLEIPGAQKLTTFTSISGNFIIPLKDLRLENLNDYLNLSQKIDANLKIITPTTTSTVNIKVPLDNPKLPPLTTTQDLDLREYTTPQKEKEVLVEAGNPYDLNSDLKINSLDIAIILENLGRNPKIPKADFNSDGIVDQKDIDLLQKAFLN